MLKAVLAANSLSDTVHVDGEHFASKVEVTRSDFGIHSLQLWYIHPASYEAVRLEFSAEKLNEARFNSVTEIFELYSNCGRYTTLNFQVTKSVLRANAWLGHIITKAQFNQLSEEDASDLDELMEVYY